MNLGKTGSVGSTERRGAPTVSFSGVDGAGKSTQIEALRSYLEVRGVRVRILRFWDDIATMAPLREQAGHRVFGGEKGIGAPGAPVKRRDKNVRGWLMTGLRLLIYFLDALSLRRVYRSVVRSGVDFVIFDRYMYDELANLDLDRGGMKTYARAILRLVPQPGVSFVLDADPEAARARKPEYPLEFLRFNRNAYLNLGRMLGLAVVPPGEINAVHRRVLEETLILLGAAYPAPRAPFERQQAPSGAEAQTTPPAF
jgi:thymidylate kinase